jgi:tetratricopeptide (TPR) repeat protein
MSLLYLLFGPCLNPRAKVPPETTNSDGPAAEGASELDPSRVHAVPPGASRVLFTQRLVQGLKSVTTALSCRFQRNKASNDPPPRTEREAVAPQHDKLPRKEREAAAARLLAADGDASKNREDYPAALDLYQAALKIHTRRADKDPDNRVESAHVVSLHQKIGGVHIHMSEALETKALKSTGPKEARAQKQAALKSCEAALKNYEAALAKRLKDTASGDLDRLSDLADLHRKVGDTYLRVGGLRTDGPAERQAALTHYEAALKIRRPLATGSGNLEWLKDLDRLHYNIVRLRFHLRENPGEEISASLMGEIEHFGQAELELRQQRVKEDPNNRNRQSDLAELHEKIGDLKRTPFEALESALRNYRKAVQTLQLLVNGAHNSTLPPLLQRCLSKLSDTCLDIGGRLERKQPWEAALVYQEGLAATRRLMIREPNNPKRRDRAATVCQRLGELYQQMGEPEQARRYYGQAIEVGKSDAGPL